MVLPNLWVFRKPRVVQFLIVAMLKFLSLGTLGFPSRVEAAGTTIGAGPLRPGPSGPLVATDPSMRDNEEKAPEGNYVRLTEYAWAFDPLEEADTSRDYYFVFISAAVQAKDGWCLTDGRTYVTGIVPPSSITPPSQSVKVKMSNGMILTDKVTPTKAHGDELGV